MSLDIPSLTRYPKGHILGEFRASGLITNPLVHVEVSQDGEMIFAGVYKGMTALLAWDMKGISSKSIKNGTFIHAVRCHRHTNARLKGFGASTLVENDASTKTEYRLLCGLGIKNINIWSVTFDKDRSDSELVQPEWECIFMGVTNGTSVELVAFRNGGREAISKSSELQESLLTKSGSQILQNPCSP